VIWNILTDSDTDSESCQNDNTQTDTLVPHVLGMVRWTELPCFQEVSPEYRIYLNIWQEFYPKFI